MIWDTFTFFNEIDLLELRLRELEGVVDRWVLVEAPVTFSGKQKPLYYSDNKQRFEQWNERITHIVVENLPTGDDAWARERAQREAIWCGLDGLQSGDTVIHTDLDEIPRAATLKHIYHPAMPDVLAMQMPAYYYYMNYRYRWDMFYGRVLRGGELLKRERSFHDYRFGPIIQDAVLRDAGWHMTYMGGLEKVRIKVGATSHWNEPGVKPMLARYEVMEPVEAEAALLQKVKVSPHTHPSDVTDRLGWWLNNGYIKL